MHYMHTIAATLLKPSFVRNEISGFQFGGPPRLEPGTKGL